jgi:hypothetical protein
MNQKEKWGRGRADNSIQLPPGRPADRNRQYSKLRKSKRIRSKASQIEMDRNERIDFWDLEPTLHSECRRI